MNEELFEEVLSGESVDLDGVFPCDVVKYMQSLGYDDSFDSNGWDWDFWIRFTHESKPKVIYAGKGYYGGNTIELDTTE